VLTHERNWGKGDAIRTALPHVHGDVVLIEPEITAKVARRGYRIYEVPISYAGRKVDEGKKITWRDGFGAVNALVAFRFAKEF
jgi:hypothetical protein